MSIVRIRLEVLSGLSETLGDKGSGPIVLNKDIEEGTTVGDVIKMLAIEHQDFGDIVFDSNTNKLSGQVAIVLNDRFLEALKGLDTNIKDGDTIKLFPLITGG